MIVTGNEPLDEQTQAKRALISRLGIAVVLILPWVPAAVISIMSGWFFSLLVWSYPFWVLACGVLAYQRFRSSQFKSARYWASIPLWIVGGFFTLFFVLIPAVASLLSALHG